MTFQLQFFSNPEWVVVTSKGRTFKFGKIDEGTRALHIQPQQRFDSSGLRVVI